MLFSYICIVVYMLICTYLISYLYTIHIYYYMIMYVDFLFIYANGVVWCYE